MDEFENLLNQCLQEGSLVRMVARARKRWNHGRSEPACSNEAAAEEEGRPLFAYESTSNNQGILYRPH
ncbi:MAG: hypothetical protein PHF67_00370 [Candidatus Nanoarchaeia archaeon]|nr:hypothetical protein [Candidatus Nanoarchaeia archaeon]